MREHAGDLRVRLDTNDRRGCDQCVLTRIDARLWGRRSGAAVVDPVSESDTHSQLCTILRRIVRLARPCIPGEQGRTDALRCGRAVVLREPAASRSRLDEVRRNGRLGTRESSSHHWKNSKKCEYGRLLEFMQPQTVLPCSIKDRKLSFTVFGKITRITGRELASLCDKKREVIHAKPANTLLPARQLLEENGVALTTVAFGRFE